MALEVERHLAEEAKKRQGQRNDLRPNVVEKVHTSTQGRASEQAAAMLKTNFHYVSDAKSIAHAAPEIARRALDGHMGMQDARPSVPYVSIDMYTPPGYLEDAIIAS